MDRFGDQSAVRNYAENSRHSIMSHCPAATHSSQPLTILSTTDIRHLLHRLTKEETLGLYETLADAFHTYSTDSSSTIQTPKPTKLKVQDGQTTIFSASSMGPAAGLQIISVPPTSDARLPVLMQRSSSLSLSSNASSQSGSTSGSSAPSSSFASSSTLVDPTSPAESIQNMSINDRPATPPTPVRSGSPTNDAIRVPRSNHLLILNPVNGQPQGMIASQSLTTFRSALTSTALLRKRTHVSNITVFGAGPLAYWHIRLSLLLRGSEIKHVNIITTKFDRSVPLMKAFYQDCQSNIALRSKAKFSVLTKEYKDHSRLLREYVRGADVIYCCTSHNSSFASGPSSTPCEPLFPHELLTNADARKKGRYITVMGGTRATHLELPIEVVHQTARKRRQQHEGHHRHHHKHAESSGVVVVDSLESCMRDGAEIVAAGLAGDQLVELGELVLLKRAAEQELEQGGGAEESGAGGKHFHMPLLRKHKETKESKESESTQALRRWLAGGDVLLKSVGLPLIDVVIGRELLRLAEEKGIGVRIEDF